MKVLMIGPIKKASGGAIHTKELISELKKLGVVVELYNFLPIKRYPSILSKIIILYKKTIGLSIKLIKDSKKFDIVHIQSSGALAGFIQSVVGSFWKKLLNFKLIITFHYRPDINFIVRYKKLFNFTLSHADHFFVVSKKQIKCISQIFGRQFFKKISVIYNGFDKTKFKILPKDKARKMLNLSLDKKIIINIGNLLPVKGQSYLIAAMRKIVDKKKDVLCIIIGDGPLRKDLENQIKKLNLENYVKLVGFKPHDEIPLWMNAADLFVLPSLSESFGIVQIEAMACGVPVVATRNGGSEEIIISEDYGFLCPPKDPECLAEKILEALEKEWDKEKIRKYAEQFTWENVAKEIIKLYFKILNENI